MGWPYSGTWEGEPVQNLASIMSSLCRAVNERIALITSDTDYLKSFWYGDGSTSKNYPSAADFDGFPIMGGAKMHANMKLIEAGIDLLLDDTPALPNVMNLNWKKASTGTYDQYISGSSAYWTKADILTAVGLGDFPSSYDRCQEADHWMRFKGCLDRMIYPRIATQWDVDTQDDYIALGAGKKKVGSAVVTGYEDAMISAMAASETSCTSSEYVDGGISGKYAVGVESTVTNTYPGYSYQYTIYTERTMHINGDLVGTVLHAGIKCDIGGYNYASPNPDLLSELSLGGQSLSWLSGPYTAAYADDVTLSYDDSCSVLPMGRCYECTAAYSPSSASNGYYINMRPEIFYIWLNISDNVTDQAT